jgi:nanoRNase/pAp phosphatase (c-di-AMP/oligoRNAs hydrolase)
MTKPASRAARTDADASLPGSPGQLPVQHLEAVLRTARAAAPERGDRVLILTHRGPDPDAIGSCEGMRALCEQGFDIPAEVATVGRIYRAENQAMVRTLNLSSCTYDELDAQDFFGAVLVDTQPEFGHTVMPDDIPLLAIFDHHVPPKVENAAAESDVAHRDVRLGIGATATIVYSYLRDHGLELEPVVATALFCGVRYDTADLSRNATDLDEEAYYTCFRKSDRALIAEIAHPPLPRDYYRDLSRALSTARQHGPLVLALLGEVGHPEFVAEMADFFLRMKGASWVVVGGACEEEGEYVLSLRTDYAFGNAYPLMARVLDGLGSFGGHGHIAGARIKLDDHGESTIAQCERQLRKNTIAILGTEDGALPAEGRPLS